MKVEFRGATRARSLCFILERNRQVLLVTSTLFGFWLDHNTENLLERFCAGRQYTLTMMRYVSDEAASKTVSKSGADAAHPSGSDTEATKE